MHDRLQIAGKAKTETLDEIEGFQRSLLVIDYCPYSTAELFYHNTNTTWEWHRVVPGAFFWKQKFDTRPWLEEWPDDIANEVSAMQAEKAWRCDWVRRAFGSLFGVVLLAI